LKGFLQRILQDFMKKKEHQQVDTLLRYSVNFKELLNYRKNLFKSYLWVVKEPFYRSYLEPGCCKKQQQKSSGPVTGLRNWGHLIDLNDSKLIVYHTIRKCSEMDGQKYIPFFGFK
jgi:hypothetical protein